MSVARCIGRNERRALAAGCEVRTIDESPYAHIFTAIGQPPRIYIPDDLPGPYRDYAVLAMFERLCARAASEDELRDIWRDMVRRVTWRPYDDPRGEVAAK